ncbi:sulfatase-like hydrolase/transferase [Allorhodopirellula solitaria]|uniref:Arylsulfatase n=1 Tax=Allorhodopirellula solitaria TaxID=2527987 RepID=A0A5C5YKJ1_9BACT|nr:sulfatase-like hydrolase/transferase [Allorhodopirellula solitaria]TWT75339.1 Arylsulfatase [Allorhodopirellula solitaria]
MFHHSAVFLLTLAFLPAALSLAVNQVASQAAEKEAVVDPAKQRTINFCRSGRGDESKAAGLVASSTTKTDTCSSCAAKDGRPNILLIVADDLGYSDLGCYGGEIDTPRLDALAADGIRFTNFHVNPMCAFTRTSLMTGHTHYESDNYLRSLPIAKIMADAGYRTLMSGKWHQPRHPMDAGFEEFYGFLEGQIDSWTGIGYGHVCIRSGRGDAKPVPDGWYSTDAFTDTAMAQIDGALEAGEPFFSYLAYNAPHTPLHAPRENVEKYPPRYRDGWSKLRQQRFQRMQEMGLIDQRYRLSEPHAEVRRWDEIRDEDRQIEANRMAAYAGMVDRLDQNIGRLIAHLRQKTALENTLVVFLSDNGGDYGNGAPATYASELAWKPGSHPMVSNGWGMLKNTPWNWYKHSMAGGVRVPMIVHYPVGVTHPGGTILKQRLHATDLYPTFLELAGVAYPNDDEGRPIKPLYGHSMSRLFRDATLPETAIHDEIFWFFDTLTNQRGLLRGQWKVISVNDSPWLLYDVKKDPAEAVGLAAEQPGRLAELVDHWHDFARNEIVAPPGAREPVSTQHQGWGLHRCRMVFPRLRSTLPANAATTVDPNTNLVLDFAGVADFADTPQKHLSLYRVSDPTSPVWQSDPDENSRWQGKRRLVFDELPQLQGDTAYFLTCDRGWVRIDGTPSGPLNDGAYWWRFRTRGE